MWIVKSNFKVPMSYYSIRDIWHEPYLILKWDKIIINRKCKLSQKDFDHLCSAYDVHNPLANNR